jgi:hypothetical protein
MYVGSLFNPMTQSLRVERRRRWSAFEKKAIVEKTYEGLDIINFLISNMVYY